MNVLGTEGRLDLNKFSSSLTVMYIKKKSNAYLINLILINFQVPVRQLLLLPM